MNSALEKMLREFASTHFFGTVEIHYANGVPTTVHVNKTYKLASAARPEINRETRGDNSGQPGEKL